MKKNRKKTTAILLLAIPFLLLAAAVRFFYWYSLVRFKPAKVKPDPDREDKGVKRRNPGDGKTFNDFRQKIVEGTNWFKGQMPETVVLRSEDGLQLTAGLLPAEQESRNVLILFHGYRSDTYADFSNLFRYYHEQGYHLLVPNQRSHGQSEGRYICFGIRERYDCKMWAEYAVGRFGTDCNLYLSGTSMGGTTVLMAAGLDLPANVRGIIADCGFTSPYDIFRHVLKRDFHLPPFPILPLTQWLALRRAGFRYKDASTLDVMRTNRIPILFIHGGKDTFVPVQMTLDNYAACAGPKELLIIPEAAHGVSSFTEPQRYRNTALQFMRSCERQKTVPQSGT